MRIYSECAEAIEAGVELVVAELVEASKRPQVFYELIKTNAKEQCQKARWWFRQAQPPQVSVYDVWHVSLLVCQLVRL